VNVLLVFALLALLSLPVFAARVALMRISEEA
jgi:hypothetical protein